MTARMFTAVLHKEEDLHVAKCPEVGTVSQGHTTEHAFANLKEATEWSRRPPSVPPVTPEGPSARSIHTLYHYRSRKALRQRVPLQFRWNWRGLRPKLWAVAT